MSYAGGVTKLSPHLIAVLALLLASALAIPTVASAQDLPDVVEDPVEAIVPQEPAAGSDPVGEPSGGEGGGGSASAASHDPAAATSGRTSAAPTAVPYARIAHGSGQLPFTGPRPGQLLLLAMVGSLTVLSGGLAFAWARGRGQVARA